MTPYNSQVRGGLCLHRGGLSSLRRHNKQMKVRMEELETPAHHPGVTNGREAASTAVDASVHAMSGMVVRNTPLHLGVGLSWE